jgi:hypothetical protein
MKKTLTAITLLAGAVAGYSQGTVAVADYGESSFIIHIYAPQTSAPTGNVTTAVMTYGGHTSGTEYMGNVSNDKPTASAGNAVYNTGSALSGTAYDLQLLGANNTGDALSALSTLGTPTTFYTSTTLAGTFKGSVSTPIPGSVPGPATDSPPGTGATVALAAWATTGPDGTASTLAAAQADGYAWGISALGNVFATGGNSSPPTSAPFLPTSIESFSIAVSAPEPSTIALGVIGASALLFRRRK